MLIKNKNYKFLSVIFVLILSGCAATLEDFEGMGSYERTEFVCENDRQTKNLKSQRDNYNRSIQHQRKVISKGYKIHRSCKEVPVVVSGNTNCYSYDGINISCQTPSEIKKEKVCEDIPVAIDGGIEEKKLKTYINSYKTYSKRLKDRVKECHLHVEELDVNSAFNYYQSVK